MAYSVPNSSLPTGGIHELAHGTSSSYNNELESEIMCQDSMGVHGLQMINI